MSLIFFIILLLTFCSSINTTKIGNLNNYCNYYSSVKICKGLNYSSALILEMDTSEKFETTHDVQFIESNLPKIPRFMFEVFPNVQKFEMINCSIKYIYIDTFKNATKLEKLLINNNDLETLTKGIFDYVPTIRVLSLQNNNLKSLPIGIFQRLENLKELYLNHNKFNIIRLELLKPLISLEIIDLSYNNIEIIDEDDFRYNLRLKKIQLNNNRIIEFHSNTIKHLKLNIFNISFNNITELHTGSVKILYVTNSYLNILYISGICEQLYANDNRLQLLSIENLTEITIINIQNNYMKDFYNISKAYILKTLDLSRNQLNSLTLNIFSTMPNLKYLNLSLTNLRGLDFGLFWGLTNLQVLDLSGNYLDRIDMDIFYPLIELYELRLESNRLRIIEYNNIKINHPNMKTIGLTDNNWDCSFLLGMYRIFQSQFIHMIIPEGNFVTEETHIAGIGCV